ncbi:hypothetical protein [Streptomyces sp. NPDC016845]|uniref:hypothetical protein n=1 Tax=Streptomyces sp. NPDC016845 TaxID=3364972 RepID=UPI0037929AE6
MHPLFTSANGITDMGETVAPAAGDLPVTWCWSRSPFSGLALAGEARLSSMRVRVHGPFAWSACCGPAGM